MRAHRDPAVAATARVIVPRGATVPGVLASLTMLGVFAVIALVPLLTLVLLVAALVLTPLGLWRLIRRDDLPDTISPTSATTNPAAAIQSLPPQLVQSTRWTGPAVAPLCKPLDG
jgi:hypothetical protein